MAMASVYRRKATDVLSASSQYLCKNSWIVSTRGFASRFEEHDAVVIGGGPGCSIKSAQPGLKNTWMNNQWSLGGTYLNPAKVLLHSYANDGVKVADLPGMLAQKDKAVGNLTQVNYVNGYGKSFSAGRIPFTSGLQLNKTGGIEAGRFLVNRQFSTSVPHKANATDDDADKEETVVTPPKAGEVVMNLRPLSPHLPIYEPHLSSTVSIINRISAVYLSAIMLLFPLLYLKIGPTCFHYQIWHQIFSFSSNLAPITLELAGLAVAYHTYMGIGHLIADFTGLRPKK